MPGDDFPEIDAHRPSPPVRAMLLRDGQVLASGYMRLDRLAAIGDFRPDSPPESLDIGDGRATLVVSDTRRATPIRRLRESAEGLRRLLFEIVEESQ